MSYYLSSQIKGLESCDLSKLGSKKVELPQANSSQASQIYLMKLASSPKCQIATTNISVFLNSDFGGSDYNLRVVVNDVLCSSHFY